jgi:uncharacterized protein
MQKIYTVIHASDHGQILRNVEKSIIGGADGTFLINMGGASIAHLQIARVALKELYPDFFVGINPLGVNPEEAFAIAENFDALWLDESYIRAHDRYDDELKAVDLLRARYKGQYFASVAFKTQGHCPDPVAVAKKAVGHCDVVTTSGPGTGFAPDVEKIKAMKEAIGDKPLAIASGVSPKNIHLFSMADAILCATGISESFTELDGNKLTEMIAISRGLKTP